MEIETTSMEKQYRGYKIKVLPHPFDESFFQLGVEKRVNLKVIYG